MKVSLMALSIGFLLALPLAATAGPVNGGGDTDGDGVENAFDNCSTLANADQADADHDACGDVCDPPTSCDVTGDGAVGIPDFQILISELGNCGGGGAPCTQDCQQTPDGVVGIPDFQELISQLGNVNGPSGITNASRDLAECPI